MTSQKFKVWFLVILALCYGPIGGIVYQCAVSITCYLGFGAIAAFNDTVSSDMLAINGNPFNTDIDKVLDAKIFSFYCGVPVFKANIERSGSFGFIICSQQDKTPFTIQHEIGHNVQQLILGPVNFLLTIGIPSFLEISNRPYYERPWECSANLFTGADTNYPPAIKTTAHAYWITALLGGPMSYLFLFGQI